MRSLEHKGPGFQKISAKVVVPNLLGLHARACARIAWVAKEYEASLTLGSEEERVEAKSILGLGMLCAPVGAEVEIVGVGPDAESAVLALSRLIQSGFGESW